MSIYVDCKVLSNSQQVKATTFKDAQGGVFLFFIFAERRWKM